VATLGRTAGRLFAVSTAGSIVGTFATAFWLVPELGIDQLLAFDAAVLFLAATVFAASQRLVVPGVVALVALAGSTAAALALAPEQGGTLSAAAARNWSPLYRLQTERGRTSPLVVEQGLKLVYRKETRYHRLAVTDDADSRYLRFDSTFQSGMYLKDPFRTRFDYTDYFDLGLAYNPGARRILFIGLGGGSAPKRMWRDFPELQIDVAEIDPDVVRVARRFFRLPSSPRLEVTAEDGRRYLARHDERWDVIALDAFYADAIPFHMATREFLELARSRLNPGGVIVTNTIGALRGEGSQLFRSLYRTYGSVFPTVAVHPVLRRGEADDGILNLMLVATDKPAQTEAFLASRWKGIRAEHPRAPALALAIRNRRLGAVPVGDVPVLTDDYAPTDALLLDDF
jgi:spermidine synthase